MSQDKHRHAIDKAWAKSEGGGHIYYLPLPPLMAGARGACILCDTVSMTTWRAPLGNGHPWRRGLSGKFGTPIPKAQQSRSPTSARAMMLEKRILAELSADKGAACVLP